MIRPAAHAATAWFRRSTWAAPALSGVVVALLATALLTMLPRDTGEMLRERSLDTVLQWSAALPAPATDAPPVVVVDIDSAALDAVGPWPWPRAAIARLIDRAGEAGAAVVGVDILFEGTSTRSPAALARQLASTLDRTDLAALAETLPDDDQRLADSLGQVPGVLGFALDPIHDGPLPPMPLAVRGRPVLDQVWRGRGAVAPAEILRDAASGLGLLALPGDSDGIVRRVPLLAGVGASVHPGLALEAVRVASGAAAYRLDAERSLLAAGPIVVPLPRDGMLRLLPDQGAVTAIPALAWPNAVIPKGALVFIGGSAPELGGLRAAWDGPLVPSVVIHARAAAQLLRGLAPVPIPNEGLVASALAGMGVLLALLAAVWVKPVFGALAVMAGAAAVWATAVWEAAHGWLLDPFPVTAIPVVAFLGAATVTAARIRLRESRIRQRFSQHLAPQVVELIANDPERLKLTGEWREITTLFTDIEGFTSLTHRAGPEALVRLLDEYFEGVARIVIRHGGMIDKLVGDAVHAFFNMPLDLPDHPLAAVRCAVEIQTWTAAHRATPIPASFELGRTRIGIETGRAIVGDVGIRAKLDYTAHGDTVNGAARLEAANKELGSAICVGPGTAARCPPGLLRPTGRLVLRGLTENIITYEPWPDDSNPAWRTRYLEAFATVNTDTAAAAAAFVRLARERPDDDVVRRLAEAEQGMARREGRLS
jgi:adenylate cyclase